VQEAASRRATATSRLNQEAPTRLIETFAPEIARLAGFVQDEWSIDKQFSLYLGARWEGVQTDSDATGMADFALAQPRAESGRPGPVQIGRRTPAAPGLTRTYKAPTVQQLTARRYEAAVNTRFNADSSGNPDLRPELANGIDFTYEHFLKDGAMFSASVSRRAISDYIRTRLDLDANGRWVYRPLNDGDALVRSLQLEAKLPDKALA
jgi:outer membrane receptor for ferrienterochelin and colicins